MYIIFHLFKKMYTCYKARTNFNMELEYLNNLHKAVGNNSALYCKYFYSFCDI